MTGTVIRTGDAYDIRFDREYAAPIADVWSAITTPERAARWIGDLRGTLAVGEKVQLVMGEADHERANLEIRECHEPHTIVVGWQFPGTRATTVSVRLSEPGPERTRLRMSHLGWAADEVAGYGCGWHHFVDSLAAYLAGDDLPDFDDSFRAALDDWRAMVAAAG